MTNKLKSVKSKFVPGGRYYQDDKKIVSPDNEEYTGDRQVDKRHEQSVCVYPDGGKYAGEWQDGKKHGRGTYIYPDGGRYAGEWKNDKRHGQGVTEPGSDKYDGEWKENKKHGAGILTSADGSRYKGEWQNDKRHGQGLLTRRDGSKYKGGWEDDKKQGRGADFFDIGNQAGQEFRALPAEKRIDHLGFKKSFLFPGLSRCGKEGVPDLFFLHFGQNLPDIPFSISFNKV